MPKVVLSDKDLLLLKKLVLDAWAESADDELIRQYSQLVGKLHSAFLEG